MSRFMRIASGYKRLSAINAFEKPEAMVDERVGTLSSALGMPADNAGFASGKTHHRSPTFRTLVLKNASHGLQS